jgi:mannose-6-phosphate isomerase-like protein (cupin superfamily)
MKKKVSRDRKRSNRLSPRAVMRSPDGASAAAVTSSPRKFLKDCDQANVLSYPGVYEGVHLHRPGDAKFGSFDEFYYIISGSGEMEIEGEKVPVTAGDHVFIPNGVAHGIENTSAEGDLKVYLLAVMRD